MLPGGSGGGDHVHDETESSANDRRLRAVVSPSLNPETARLCNRYQIPYMPGASTVKEVVEGMEWGADIVKVFPGETLGVAFVKAVWGHYLKPRSCQPEV